MTTENQTQTVGLCLSGGGAIGFAHIGVLKALEENGIQADFVSGSSMGAIIGTLYSAGYSPEEMMQMIQEDRLYRVSKLMSFKPSFWKSGFSGHSTVENLIHETIPHNSFEGLQRRMHVCVTNLTRMEWEIKDHGADLADWVAASSSIPGVFEAIEKEGAFYLDGGVLNNLPAQAIRPLCHTLIGVDVLPHIPPKKLKQPIDAITSSIRGIQHLNSAEGRSLCDFVIETTALKRYHEFRFDAYLRIYKQGYKDALEFIQQHPEMLKR